MFEKFKNLITNFFKEVMSDFKKFKIASIFTDLKFLTIFILSLAVILILALNMNFFTLIKGIVFILIFYFVFLWKK